MHTLKKKALSLLSLLLPLTLWAAAPSNDNFGSAIALTGDTPSITTVDISEATRETGDVCTGYQSVWYSWTPEKTMRVTMTLTGTITSTDDTVNDLTGYVEVFAGNSLSVLHGVCGGSHVITDDATYSQASASFIAVKGVPYKIVISTGASTSVATFAMTSTSVIWDDSITVVAEGAPTATAPANDNFANAKVVPSTLPVAIIGYPTSATREALESSNGYRTLWYSFTPDATCELNLDMEGSAYGSWVSVYQGSSLDTLCLVGQVYNAGAGTVPVQAGKRYYIATGNYYDYAYFNSVVTISKRALPAASVIFPADPTTRYPANDNFANAVDLGSQNLVTAVAYLYHATQETADPANKVQTVWYKWTAPADGVVDFRISPANTDQMVLVYTGEHGSLKIAGTVSVGCTTVETKAGTTYYVLVSAYYRGYGAWAYVTVQPNMDGEVPTTTAINMAAVSTRAYCKKDSAVIPGFVVAGVEQYVIVRAAGPSLSASGIQNYMRNPKLDLYKGSTAHASNDDWTPGSASILSEADIGRVCAAVGLTPFVSGSKDAVIIRKLSPGVYTAHATSSTDTQSAYDSSTSTNKAPLGEGEVVVEVYTIPAGVISATNL